MVYRTVSFEAVEPFVERTGLQCGLPTAMARTAKGHVDQLAQLELGDDLSGPACVTPQNRPGAGVLGSVTHLRATKERRDDGERPRILRVCHRPVPDLVVGPRLPSGRVGGGRDRVIQRLSPGQW